MTLEEEQPIINKGSATINNKPMEIKKDHNYFVSLLCIFFGMGAWILINSVYTQLPILVQNAPEGWSLPSYFSLLVQFANIGPLLYIFLRNRSYFIKDSILICIFLTLGTASILALAFTYDKTGYLFGQLHSIYFFIFSFVMSLVGCISSVLFIPFMNSLPEVYLVPYFIGEGLSGFMPSFISMFQGVQNNPTCVNLTTEHGTDLIKKYNPPLFSTKIFFILISIFMISSTASFIYLQFSKRFKNVRIIPADKTLKPTDVVTEVPEMLSPKYRSAIVYVILLLLQMIVNAFANGILPSIQSYSCLPYGSNTYHWAVNIGQIASPLIYYVSFFIPLTSLKILSVGCIIFIGCVIYEFVTALMSPSPPLVDSTLGTLLVVVTWVLSSASVSFVKLSIAAIFRRRKGQALFHYGIMTQIGSALGAVLSFGLINYANIFHANSTDKC